ncbi:MAG: isoprenylcysteine carboxylmethyltransferase family protein [Candidatus Pacebacteria bacterium]|nr:isoprenylcysteine carboxylmethyltransferase family protein [Candidatus Paceibacterota bacterium]
MEEAKKSVHKILASSYLSYFLLILGGLFFDIFFPLKFSFPNGQVLTIIFFAVGPALILWAQHSSHKFEKIKEKTGSLSFGTGPYKYLRNPTQLGLVILVAGYAFASGAAVLFIAVGIAYLISNIFFRKHESVLEARYGEHYSKYRDSVRKII